MSKPGPNTTASGCRLWVHRLLRSASDPLIDQTLLDHGAESEVHDGYYVLEAKIDNMYGLPPGLRLAHKSNSQGPRPGARTAATHALIYACSRCDLETVSWLTQTLGELININLKIGGRNVFDWTVSTGYLARGARDDVVSICRLLLVRYGSMLEASCLGDQFLFECIKNGYIDIVTHLMTFWGSMLMYRGNVGSIFSYLVACGLEGQDEASELYLRLNADIMIGNYFEGTMSKVVHEASARVFRYVLNMFPSKCAFIDRGHMFEGLCKVSNVPDCAGKILVALDAWFDSLTAQNIENGLVYCWQWEECATDKILMNQVQRVACTVIERCMNKLEGQGIEIAMTLCVAFQNIGLMGKLIDCYSHQIAANSQLLYHPLIMCCWTADIDTFEHLLTRCRLTICVQALEFWCETGDLEVVTMILDTSCQDLIECLPSVLLSACRRGDTSIVELLVRHAGDSIRGSDYVEALNEACYNNHGDVVQTLVTLCGHHFSIRTDADYELDLKRTDPDIIRLLNDLFGSSLDPAAGTATVPRHFSLPGEHDVKYNVGMKTVYDLCID